MYWYVSITSNKIFFCELKHENLQDLLFKLTNSIKNVARYHHASDTPAAESSSTNQSCLVNITQQREDLVNILSVDTRINIEDE